MNRKLELLQVLNRVNNLLGLEYDLNNAPIYGGWQLTNKEGSHIVKHRVSIKEMLCFLDGMVKALSVRTLYEGKE